MEATDVAPVAAPVALAPVSIARNSADLHEVEPTAASPSPSPSLPEDDDAAEDLDLAEEAQLLAGLASSAPAHPTFDSAPAKTKGRRRGRSQKFCIVDNCGVSVDKMPIWFRKTKCCMKHSRAPEVTLHGVPQRLCQKCSRFHTLDKFDGLLRSCREKLELHNEARKKRLREEKEAHVMQRVVTVGGHGAEGSHGSASTAAAAAGTPRWAPADVAVRLQAYGADAHGSAMAAAAAAISELAAVQQQTAAQAQAQGHHATMPLPTYREFQPPQNPIGERDEHGAAAGGGDAGLPRWGVKRTRNATPTMSLGEGPSAFHMPIPRGPPVVTSAPAVAPAAAAAPTLPAAIAAPPPSGADLLSQIVAQLNQVQAQGGLPPPPVPASLLPPAPPPQHQAIAAVLAAAQAQQRQHAANLAQLNTLLRMLCNGGA